MPYARFNMAEFSTHDDMRVHAAELHSIINQIFPEIRGFFFVETSDTSALTISVYDDQEAADRALEQRENYHLDKKFTDIFHHEGVVTAHYIDQTQMQLWGEAN